MQREILFRALRKDGQGWVEGFYLHYSSRHEILVPHSQEVLDYDLYPVHPETVGQYTGLTDKNGVRIFEGDVVRHSLSENIFDGKGSEKRVIESVVFWQEFRAVFALQMTPYANNDLFKYVKNGGDGVVIGNIHEGGDNGQH